MADRPAAPRVWSRPFNGGAQAGKRIAQIWIRYVNQLGRDARDGFAVEAGPRQVGLAAQRGLPQAQASHRLPAQEAINALQNDGGEVLDFDRGRPFDPQHQRAGLRSFAVARPRPADFFRLRMAGNLRADDFGPPDNELGGGEPLLGENVVERLVQVVHERTRV
jgi:hypothetical protein